MDQIAKKPPNALPVTVQDLEAKRKVFHQPTLNDRVDAVFVRLWENEEFRGFLDGVYDEDCKEGSRSADDYTAARMIREYAVENKEAYVASKKIATLMKALKVVMNRYGIGRKQRAFEVAGQTVDMSGSNNGE